jgi:hypothetical protein
MIGAYKDYRRRSCKRFCIITRFMGQGCSCRGRLRQMASELPKEDPPCLVHPTPQKALCGSNENLFQGPNGHPQGFRKSGTNERATDCEKPAGVEAFPRPPLTPNADKSSEESAFSLVWHFPLPLQPRMSMRAGPTVSAWNFRDPNLGVSPGSAFTSISNFFGHAVAWSRCLRLLDKDAFTCCMTALIKGATRASASLGISQNQSKQLALVSPALTATKTLGARSTAARRRCGYLTHTVESLSRVASELRVAPADEPGQRSPHWRLARCLLQSPTNRNSSSSRHLQQQDSHHSDWS